MEKSLLSSLSTALLKFLIITAHKVSQNQVGKVKSDILGMFIDLGT